MYRQASVSIKLLVYSLQLFTFISMSQRKEFAPKSILLILRCLKIYFKLGINLDGEFVGM